MTLREAEALVRELVVSTRDYTKRVNSAMGHKRAELDQRKAAALVLMALADEPITSASLDNICR